MAEPLDTPRTRRRFRLPKIDLQSEGVAHGAEAIARFSGTPQFLVYLSAFVIVWILWNTLAPASMQFDKAELGFTALTLMLSLQASYSAPLILLAQNRQDDRDRVQAEQDRQTSERNLADTEYLTREIAALRQAIGDVATRDFIRSELRDAIEDLRTELTEVAHEAAERAASGDDDGDHDGTPADDAPELVGMSDEGAAITGEGGTSVDTVPEPTETGADGGTTRP